MIPSAEASLRVLTLGLTAADRAALDAQAQPLNCVFEHVPTGDDALAAVSSGYFAVLVLGGLDDAAALRAQVDALSQDQQTCSTPMLLYGPAPASELDGLQASREGGIDWLPAPDTAQLLRRLRWMLDLGRLRRREQQLLHTLAFKEQELESEIEHRRQAEQAAAHGSSHDSLTDLPNRAVFEDRLDMAVQRAKRSGARMALLHIDIKGFRPVNAGYGHTVGDRLLCAMARRIRETIRRSDTVSRIAGDEFGVILEEVQDAESANQLGHKLIDVLSLPFTLEIDGEPDPTVLEVGVRVGVAMFPDCPSRAALLQAADQSVMAARERDAREPVRVSP